MRCVFTSTRHDLRIVHIHGNDAFGLGKAGAILNFLYYTLKTILG